MSRSVAACPFCDSYAVGTSKDGDKYYTRCLDCGARGPLKDTVLEAGKAWGGVIKWEEAKSLFEAGRTFDHIRDLLRRERAGRP